MNVAKEREQRRLHDTDSEEGKDNLKKFRNSECSNPLNPRGITGGWAVKTNHKYQLESKQINYRKR